MKKTAPALTLITALSVSMLAASVPSLKALSEAPQLEWVRDYGGYAGGHSVVQTNDGGYAIAGENATYGIHGYDYFYPLLIKTASTGDIQWEKTYGGEFGVGGEALSVVQTKDSGYALSGEGDWLLKLDDEGNVQWNKTFGFPLRQCRVIQATDGSYVLAGWMDSNAGGYEALLLKTDETGNQL
jgi:hypothetical protein